jgi:hypothetical protein
VCGGWVCVPFGASSHVMSALLGYAPAVLVGVIAAVRAR